MFGSAEDNAYGSTVSGDDRWLASHLIPFVPRSLPCCSVLCKRFQPRQVELLSCVWVSVCVREREREREGTAGCSPRLLSSPKALLPNHEYAFVLQKYSQLRWTTREGRSAHICLCTSVKIEEGVKLPLFIAKASWLHLPRKKCVYTWRSILQNNIYIFSSLSSQYVLKCVCNVLRSAQECEFIYTSVMQFAQPQFSVQKASQYKKNSHSKNKALKCKKRLFRVTVI